MWERRKVPAARCAANDCGVRCTNAALWRLKAAEDDSLASAATRRSSGTLHFADVDDAFVCGDHALSALHVAHRDRDADPRDALLAVNALLEQRPRPRCCEHSLPPSAADLQCLHIKLECYELCQALASHACRGNASRSTAIWSATASIDRNR